MAHQWYRGNLSAAKFPFATPLWGRSVIMPQLDQNYDRITAAYNKDVDKGIPQAFYMENVLPTPQGYMSIGYDTAVKGKGYLATVANPTAGFDTVFELRYNTPEFAKFLFSPAGGNNWVYSPSFAAIDGSNSGWLQASPFAAGTYKDLPGAVTTAFVNGVTYIYFSKVGCYKFNQTTKTLDPVALTGLDATLITGICASAGYLLAYDEDSVSWSSATDPTDFTPSLLTGAGGGSPQFPKGKIKFGLPISGGFLLYCEKNVVSGTYSGNIRFPFIFAEVVGSGGCDSPEKVSWTSNLDTHYAWTTTGLQELNKSKAAITSDEATDFLAGGLYEELTSITEGVDYNGYPTVDVTFTETAVASLYVAVTVVADRWVVVSYGQNIGKYTYALVYDISLKRWGKLKVKHSKCFEWPAPNLYGAVTYGQLINNTYGSLISTTYGDLLTSVDNQQVVNKQIAFLSTEVFPELVGADMYNFYGRIFTVNMDFAQSNADGILMLGKFQVQRNKVIIHHNSDVETSNFGPRQETLPPQTTQYFDTYILPTFDGRSFITGRKLTLNYGVNDSPSNTRLVKKYSGTISGLNVAVLFRGAFNINSYLMDFALGGEV